MKNSKPLISVLATVIASALIACAAVGCVHYEDTPKKIVSFDDCMRQDNDWMSHRYGNDYRWYGCGMLLKDYLDEDCDGTLVDLTNVFMVRSDPGKSYDTNIIMLHHDSRGMGVYELKSRWVEEDVFIKKELVNVTLKESLIKAKSVKPVLHTKHVVLRKQLGPNDTNPQFIYGNNHGLVFIDARTCQAATDSPAFRNTGFITWLGEWPE